MNGAHWLAAHVALAREKAARPATADDLVQIEAIRDLITANAVFYDAGALDELIALFAPDAVYSSYLGTYRGHDELRQNFAPLIERFEAAAHLVTNTTVVIDSSDAARAVSYLQAAVQTTDAVSYVFAGSYRDTFRRIDGRWRFATRDVVDGLAYNVEAVPVSQRLPADDH